MSVLHALVLGVIQGVSEFLPVSSSGHLIFLPRLFGWEDQGLTFDVVLHMGTLIAVCVYFRKTIVAILRSYIPVRGTLDPSKKEARNLGAAVVIATIPAVIGGFILSEVLGIEIRSAAFVAWGLIGWGIILGIADVYARHVETHRTRVGWLDAVLIGCAQVLALLPGTSRSGITMTAGLALKFSKKQAAEFSFLMSIPIIAMAGVLKLFELLKHGGDAIALVPFGIGFLASALSGYLAIWGLLKIIQKWSFLPFVVYRVLIGILILLILV